MTIRKIIHIDMDAFYASIEQRDNPELKGKPVIVGGDPKNRGVVSACSYEARKFGIHSAMSSARALKLCPQAVFLPPNFDSYCYVSGQMMKIFHEYTDLVEPMSLDEAYLDVTENFKCEKSATLLAREIKKRIYRETSLTASSGVSYNKFLAKVASDYNKPDGITVITPERAVEFIESLPIRKFYGIGKATEKRMKGLGIHYGKDIKLLGMNEMIKLFGKAGEFYYYISRGIDNRSVNPERIRKSLGKEITLSRDIDDLDGMMQILSKIAGRVHEDIIEEGIKARTLTLKVKYHDFRSVTRSVTLIEPFTGRDTILLHAGKLLNNTEAGKEKVRLLGISLSNFIDEEELVKSDTQLILPFETGS